MEAFRLSPEYRRRSAMGLSVVVDENVPYARETFGRLGSVKLLPGRLITTPEVRKADVLIVRSVTRVGPDLLEGSRARFVGTATIGFDHVDTRFLAENGICFVSAPGSNANSVAEYVMAALLLMSRRRERPLEGSTLAVVGVGNVGSRVVQKAEALGMRCLLNDPPRQRETGRPEYLPLDAVLGAADYVTVHVPLSREGPDATWKAVNDSFFDAMKPGACFVNTSRGRVVDESALRRALGSGRVPLAVLDVWEGEPTIDPVTVEKVMLGTPHIAGYSFDGKVAATIMLYHALCEGLGVAAGVGMEDLLPPSPVPSIDLTQAGGSDEEVLRLAIPHIYDIVADDRDLRRAMTARARRGIEFDLLRKNYRKRREFHNTKLAIPDNRDSLARKASGLGFKIE
jgi:erythronate-4-phosphate dehydrogenase